ncbi:potassium channel family protein [Actinocorallia longicatena]|uniref:Ion channel n=1 Tax=Actinocorallia longicatena TaxID=111803 RepID=A0ABP6QFC5_9ACTN
MPIALLRVLHGITAKAWRAPALAMLSAFVVGFLLIHFCEPADAKIREPWNYLWYFFVSGTTVGYGDLFPVSAGGRVGAVLIVSCGLSAGLVLFAELTLWLAKGQTLKATGHARLHHENHVIVIGYRRSRVLEIVKQLRNDPKHTRTPVVVVFWEDQLSGENPDPGVLEVIAFDGTAFERACLDRAATVFVQGRDHDETVRVMLDVNAHAAASCHLVAAVPDGVRRAEFQRALSLINPEIEPVGTDDPAVVADVIRNPGVATIYSNLASTLDADSSLFRVDVPEGEGPWTRLALAVHLLERGCTLLAVGESSRPNARFRLDPDPAALVGGGQSLAIVAHDRPEIVWSGIPTS